MNTYTQPNCTETFVQILLHQILQDKMMSFRIFMSNLPNIVSSETGKYPLCRKLGIKSIATEDTMPDASDKQFDNVMDCFGNRMSYSFKDCILFD